jgi:hypothetical protein
MVNAREGLLEREKEIIRLLHVLSEEQSDFIVVGGYAIATYKKRFSVDIDLVIKEEDLQKFEKICQKEGYVAAYGKDVHRLYGEKFKRYVKTIKGFKVSIDFLINGLVSRSTDATWSFDYIKAHACKGSVEGVEFAIPERELLIAMKLHSGRLGDIRDIVAIMPCEKNALKKHLIKGNLAKLRSNIERQEKVLHMPQFDDSFKGVFGIQAYNQRAVEETKKLIVECKPQ